MRACGVDINGSDSARKEIKVPPGIEDQETDLDPEGSDRPAAFRIQNRGPIAEQVVTRNTRRRRKVVFRALGVDVDPNIIVHKEPENRDGFLRMRRAGVSFAYVRLGEFGKIDDTFPDFWERAGKAGLLRGSYYAWHHDPHFRPDDPSRLDPAIKLIADHHPKDADLPFVIDFEDQPTVIVDRTHEVFQFLNELRKSIDRLVIYTNNGWWTAHTHPKPWMMEFDFWIARYLRGQQSQKTTRRNPHPPPKPILDDWIKLQDFWPKGRFFPSAVPGGPRPKVWQWTGDFYILPGLGDEAKRGAPLDINWFDGDLNDLREWAGLPRIDDHELGFMLRSDNDPTVLV